MRTLTPIAVLKLAGALAGLALACNLSGTATPIPAPPAPTHTALPPAASPLPTIGPTPSPPAPSIEAEEAILILEPGPGSRLTSPLHVSGIADPTFEQTLGVRLVLDDGTQLAAGPAMIHTELGTRGPFDGELSFSVSSERNALLQVFDASARDGGITHLASVGVTLAPGGPADVVPAAPHPEAIVIHQPEAGATVSGGTVLVEGVGVASFEGTLVVEVYDAEGLLVGSEPLIAAAPEMGQPGTFSVSVPYSVSSAGPGRVRVVDPLPAFNGIGHVASVELMLEP